MSETPNPERDRRDPYGEPGPGHYDDHPHRDGGLSEDARRDVPRDAGGHPDRRHDEPYRDDVRRDDVRRDDVRRDDVRRDDVRHDGRHDHVRHDDGYQREVHHHHEAPPAYAAHPDAVPPRRSRGLGVAAMICGIVGLLLLFVPLLQLASLILCPLAIILGIIAAKKREGRGQGIAGIITGAIGLFLIALGVVIGIIYGDDIMDRLNQLEQEAGAIMTLLS